MSSAPPAKRARFQSSPATAAAPTPTTTVQSSASPSATASSSSSANPALAARAAAEAIAARLGLAGSSTHPAPTTSPAMPQASSPSSLVFASSSSAAASSPPAIPSSAAVDARTQKILELTQKAAASQARLAAKATRVASGLPPSGPGPATLPATADARTSASAAAAVAVSTTSIPSFMPAPLLLDAQGRRVDAEGRLIEVTTALPAATSLVNIQIQQQRAARAARLAASQTLPIATSSSSSSSSAGGVLPFGIGLGPTGVGDLSHVDLDLPRTSKSGDLMLVPRERGSKALRFFEPGRFLQKEQKQLAAEQAAQEAEAARAAARAIEQPLYQVLLSEIPSVEWWDTPLLSPPANSYDCPLAESRINSLIQHPVPVQPPLELPPPPPRPLPLTAEERRKLRRRTREGAHKELTLRIQLGLVPAPPPKVKLSNMYRVYGDEAIRNPTKVENEVRRQVKARMEAHLQRNEQNKLTPEEKSAKQFRKHEESTETGVGVKLYRIVDLRLRSLRKLIEDNARWNHLSGCCLVFKEDRNFVVVEGGPKGLERFHRLLTTRVDWNRVSSHLPLPPFHFPALPEPPIF